MKKHQQKQNSFDLREFELLYDYVLVEAVREEKVGELIKPESYEDKTELGTVIAVGPGKILDDGTLLPMPVKAGDTVFYGKFLSEQSRIGGTDFLLMHAEDIRGVKRK